MAMAMAMQQIALLLLAAGTGLAAGTSSVITTTCAVMSNFTKCVDYEYCVGALSADPSGASATDAHGLAAVAANLTVANVTSTVLVHADLVNLGQCLSIYREMKESVAGALDDIRAGRADAASEKLTEAAGLPDECDILLFQGSAKNPDEAGEP